MPNKECLKLEILRLKDKISECKAAIKDVNYPNRTFILHGYAVRIGLNYA